MAQQLVILRFSGCQLRCTSWFFCPSWTSIQRPSRKNSTVPTRAHNLIWSRVTRNVHTNVPSGTFFSLHVRCTRFVGVTE